MSDAPEKAEPMTIFDVSISVDAAKVIRVIADHREDAARKALAIFCNDLYPEISGMVVVSEIDEVARKE